MKLLKTAAIACGVAVIPAASGAQALAVPAQITVKGVGAAEGTVNTVKIRIYATLVAEPEEILSAMRAAGIDDPIIGPPEQGVPTVVRGTIEHATSQRLAAARKAAEAFAVAHKGTVATVIFYGSSEECPAIEARARIIALDDARRRAQAAALALSGASIGAPVATNESGGCPASGPVSGANTINPVTMKMRVSISEEVTFTAAPSGQQGSH